jgi:alpha-D-ribose 1-methylphosphonate 5-phosphate C-P lyase
MAETLYLFGAGREKRIYAIPPYTKVEPLEFEDFKFRIEDFKGESCMRCASKDTFLDEIIDDATGRRMYFCSDTGYCDKALEGKKSKYYGD